MIHIKICINVCRPEKGDDMASYQEVLDSMTAMKGDAGVIDADLTEVSVLVADLRAKVAAGGVTSEQLDALLALAKDAEGSQVESLGKIDSMLHPLPSF